TMAATKTAKEQKYDRQLRLWGDHGQEELENAHVCLINSTASGTEILKNLVLPGIGAFTIVDGHKVSGEDVGNKYESDSPDKLLDNDPEFFHRFTLVIGVQLPERCDSSSYSYTFIYQHTFLYKDFYLIFMIVIQSNIKLGSVLWNANVPFLVCRTYGLVGYMRLVVKEHTVIESHPDNALEDLRLDQPFAELKSHIQSYDLEGMGKKAHSTAPYDHNFQLPKNYKEKEAFKQLIRQGILKNEKGTPEVEENFEEAIKNVNTALNPTKISSGVDDLFNGEQCNAITSQTPAFWVMTRAVREFVQNDGGGNLPVRGSIPDMIADSEKFINLQNVYREKAMQDASVVSKHVESLLQSVGKVCKNAAFLRVVRCRSLAEEYSVETVNKDAITCSMDGADGEMVLYLMLRSVDRFYQQHSRYPGVYNYQVEEDISKLKLCVNSLLQEYGLNVSVKDDYIHEFCRYGAAEPHTVASFLGGSAAQEAIKLITRQFVPFNNTFVYNAMSQTTATFQL
uniref:NEDD8-activating enzyme E1 regulatory subunit n=1 Tax=Oncorhynchus tshawytscha TaxID=74940 RepID=A0A8C8MFF1_ONCTS